MFNKISNDVERRVTSLEVELRGISDNLRNLNDVVRNIGDKIEKNYENLNKDMESRSSSREKAAIDSRRFLISTLFVSLSAIGSLIFFTITSLTDGKIQPLKQEIISLEKDLTISQDNLHKTISYNYAQQIMMYRELSGGKTWPMSTPLDIEK